MQGRARYKEVSVTQEPLYVGIDVSRIVCLTHGLFCVNLITMQLAEVP